MKGYFQACALMRKLKPDIVFSKGGFVSVPVVLAAKHAKIPTIIHESDITPGLANRIAIPAASRVCCNFPETIPHLPEGKAVLSGSPIRAELLHGDKKRAYTYTCLTPEKPVILVVGGKFRLQDSFNDTVRGLLPQILKNYRLSICAERAIWIRHCTIQKVMSSMNMQMPNWQTSSLYPNW